MNLRQLKEQKKKAPCTSDQSIGQGIGDWNFGSSNQGIDILVQHNVATDFHID